MQPRGPNYLFFLPIPPLVHDRGSGRGVVLDGVQAFVRVGFQLVSNPVADRGPDAIRAAEMRDVETINHTISVFPLHQ